MSATPLPPGGAAPALGPMGLRLQERTAPLAPDDGAYGWAHALLCEAMGLMLARTAEIFDPPDDLLPGAPLVSIDLCPDWALPWLAQLVGVTLPAGDLDPDAIRLLIGEVSGWKRGTPAAMRAAAGYWLTDTKTVYFRERDQSAYRVEVITRTAETPDPAAVLASLLRQKPAGLVLSYRTVEMWDYEQQTTEYTGQTYADLAGDYTSYYALTNKEPGP